MATVLIAEDNIGLCTVIEFAVQRAGFTPIVARNGRLAFEAALRGQVDVLVTDQQMPEMSGVELTAQLRATEKYRTLPVLMLTAKALELDSARLSQELGVTAVLGKPFSPIELVERIRATLSN